MRVASGETIFSTKNAPFFSPCCYSCMTSAPRLASAPRGQSLHLRPMHCQTACSYIAAAASTRPSACSRSLRPCPHRCCQSHDSSAGSSLWLCTRPTARTALQVCVWRRPSNGPCASRTAQLHARMRQRRMLPELPRDGRRSSVRASAGWEGVGGRVAGVRDPEARDLGRSGPRRNGLDGLKAEKAHPS